MSNKGERKKIKAFNAPRTVQINRKTETWTVKTRAGTHKAQDSVALGIVLRNYIKIANTMKEAKTILTNNEVKVNSKITKDYRIGIGLFDVVSLEKQKKSYRTILDEKGRLRFVELQEDSDEKISKVQYKIVTKKGIQITTNDGYNFINDKAKVGDSVKIKTSQGKIESILPMKEGSLVYITKGKHCAQKGTIQEIIVGSVRKDKLVKIKQDEKTFETIAKNVIVIGEKEAVIADLKKL
ncbi:MAG: 30S ribosomal protein S4e [archaeon]|jgi:small subunit ribosomal protein S4e